LEKNRAHNAARHTLIFYGDRKMADKKVLVVDDEVHIVHVVAIKLRNNGYEVISADNGAEAFELACNESPDIIVTDFQMPVMTGLELVEKLRKNEETKDIPVIMLTARSFAIPKKQQEDLRIAGCLSKPFSPKELLGNIEDVLYQKQVMVRS
jgi:CheY-like chemotaxis protein